MPHPQHHHHQNDMRIPVKAKAKARLYPGLRHADDDYVCVEADPAQGRFNETSGAGVSTMEITKS